MTNNTEIKREALTLTLCLWDSPMGEIVGHHLFEGYPAVANELLHHGWLVPRGVLHHRIHPSRDYFVDVRWDGARQQYGYSEDEQHWQPVPTKDITRYAIDEQPVLRWLQVLFGIDDYYRITSLANNSCWYLGVTHAHPYRAHIYFARQLHLREVQKTLQSTLQDEVGHVPALIIHSGRLFDYGVTWPLDRRLVSLENLLARTDQRCQIHKPTLAALMKSLYCHASPDNIHGDKALHFSTDYRQVYWRGQSYQLTKKQAAAIEALHKSGGRAHKDFLCAAANTNTPLYQIFRSRIDNRYQPHPLWQTLIVSEGDGYYALSST